MKTRITIIIVFLSLNIFSQQSAVVTFETKMYSYPIDTTKVSDKQVLSLMKNKIRTIKTGLNFLEFKLKFNKEKSTFYSTIPMQIDNGIDFQEMLIFLDADGTYFKNNQLSIRQINFNNKKYNVRQPNTFKWKIHNEENLILNYNVRKATTNKKLENGDIIEIEAWFAPELPFQYGIKEFNSLPGLILKIREKSIEYTAKKIKFEDDIEISKPENGIDVSQDEFTKIVRKYYGR